MRQKTDDFTRRIQQKADIVEVIQKIGGGTFPSLHKGAKTRGRHDCSGGEANACVVNGLNNTWHCYRCGKGGDTIKWVLHQKFNGDPTRFRESVEWLADFYGMRVSESPLDIPRYKAYDTLTHLSYEWNKQLLDNKERLKWVKKQWNLTSETIESLCIGFCPGLSDSGMDKSDLVSCGLLDEKARQPLANRVVFPFFRFGQVVWISGRLPHDSADQPKYTALNKTPYVAPTLYNFDVAFNAPKAEPLVFTEGLADAARAYQEGIRTVATGGAQAFNKAIHDDAKSLLSNCEDFKYIVFDSEESGSGFKGAKGLAQALIGFGYDPIIAELPRDGKPHMDLCEYLNFEGPDKFYEVLGEAIRDDKDQTPRTLPNILIDECPDGADFERITKILKVIAPLNDVMATKYVESISRKTKGNLTQLKKELTKSRKSQEKTTRKIDTDYSKQKYISQDFELLEDLDVWRAHTCYFVPYSETVKIGEMEEAQTVLRPVHITTDMGADDTWTITQNNVITNPTVKLQEFIPSEAILLDDENEWSIKGNDYSFMSFLEGSCPEIDSSELYKRIYKLFDSYVWLPNNDDKIVLTLYTMMTYIFMGLNAIPYLHLNGKRGSGKSVVMDLMTQTCFNAAATTNLSPAVMFRISHATRPTFIVDETENLRNPRPGTMDWEVLQLALGSYVNTGQARSLRCGKDDLQPIKFRTYCPKIFGGINSLKDTLASRTIRIECLMPSKENLWQLHDWDQEKVYILKECQEIRDMLRVWALTKFREVRQVYDKIGRRDMDFLLARDRQLWLPLVAIARVVSKAWGHDIEPDLLALARDKITKYRIAEATNEFANMVLITLYRLWQNTPQDQRTAIGYYFAKRYSDHRICLAMATTAVKQKMMSDQMWIDSFHHLDSNFLLNQLRSCMAIPSGVRSSSARIQNEVKDVYPFYFEKLQEHLEGKGLIGEDVSVDDDTPVVQEISAAAMIEEEVEE